MSLVGMSENEELNCSLYLIVMNLRFEEYCVDRADTVGRVGSGVWGDPCPVLATHVLAVLLGTLLNL